MAKRTQRSELPMLGVLFIAGGFFVGAAVAAPVINVGPGSGPLGGTAKFSVTLTTNGAEVAGTQNDISFDSKIPIGVGTSGYCSITVSKTCSAPADCPISPPPFTNEPCIQTCVSGKCVGTGENCSGDTDCPLHCAVTTTQTCTKDADCPVVHEPCIPAGGPDCSVTPALAPVCTGDASISCTQNADCVGTCVSGSNVCSNDASKSCTQASEASDCNFGACVGKAGYFSFQPPLCTPTTAGSCTGIRALIVAINNLVPIPDNSTLYSCNVSIASDATGPYTLGISNTRASDTKAVPINEACVSGHCAVTTTQTCDTLAKCPSIVTGNNDNGTITVTAAASYTVCDVFDPRGDNAGEFGDGQVNFFDVIAIFNAYSFSDLPAAGTARLSAMDSFSEDVPPSCGGDGQINFFDVITCFNLYSFGGTTYVRTGIPPSCSSAVKPQ